MLFNKLLNRMILDKDDFDVNDDTQVMSLISDTVCKHCIKHEGRCLCSDSIDALNRCWYYRRAVVKVTKTLRKFVK